MQANKLFDLGGKVALVTGGSRGIGFQMAEALGEMGCKLAISARKQHELDAASAALRRTNIEVLTIAKDRRCPRCVHPLAGRWKRNSGS